MPKAYAQVQTPQALGRTLQLQVDLWITDNAGAPLQNLTPDTQGGRIPRQSIPFAAGSAATIIDAIEAKAIAVAAGFGVTIAATDVVIDGLVQGA